LEQLKVAANKRGFLIDTKWGKPSNELVAQQPLTKGVLSGPGDTAVSGDSEKSRSRSVGDNHLVDRKETMKMRLLLTLAGLAIGFVVPALAQEQNTVDPEARQQIEAIHMKFYEAFNKHDAAAIAALFTQDALK
jgi:hypothetical protein